MGAVLAGKTQQRKPQPDQEIAADCPLYSLLDRAAQFARDVGGDAAKESMAEGVIVDSHAISRGGGVRLAGLAVDAAAAHRPDRVRRQSDSLQASASILEFMNCIPRRGGSV